jgi:transposase-like protein
MSVSKRRRFPTDVILVCVRWYCKYGISYRDLSETMQEHGVEVDHTTIFRWVRRYAPEIEKHVRWYQGYRSASWRVDETYVRVGDAWKYLVRAVDKTGRLIDFMLSDRRNTRAALSITLTSLVPIRRRSGVCGERAHRRRLCSTARRNTQTTSSRPIMTH